MSSTVRFCNFSTPNFFVNIKGAVNFFQTKYNLNGFANDITEISDDIEISKNYCLFIILSDGFDCDFIDKYEGLHIAIFDSPETEKYITYLNKSDKYSISRYFDKIFRNSTFEPYCPFTLFCKK
jgi:hypothetical protein